MRFYLPDFYPLDNAVVKCVLILVGAGIVACSFLLFKRRCYWVALLAPLTCLSLFVFSSLTLFNFYCDERGNEYRYRDDLNDDYAHPYYHLMDGMIPSEPVVSLAGCFVDYTPRYYLDERRHPQAEIPVNVILFFLAPTTPLLSIIQSLP